MSDLDAFTPSQPDSCPDEKSRGGAPRGNTNALKHGFYSRRFNCSEVKDLDDLPSIQDMKNEGKLLMVLTRRVFDSLEDGTRSHEDLLTTLDICCKAITCLDRIARTQSALGITPQNELIAAINQAIADVSKELVKADYG